MKFPSQPHIHRLQSEKMTAVHWNLLTSLKKDVFADTVSVETILKLPWTDAANAKQALMEVDDKGNYIIKQGILQEMAVKLGMSSTASREYTIPRREELVQLIGNAALARLAAEQDAQMEDAPPPQVYGPTDLANGAGNSVDAARPPPSMTAPMTASPMTDADKIRMLELELELLRLKQSGASQAHPAPPAAPAPEPSPPDAAQMVLLLHEDNIKLARKLDDATRALEAQRSNNAGLEAAVVAAPPPPVPEPPKRSSKKSSKKSSKNKKSKAEDTEGKPDSSSSDSSDSDEDSGRPVFKNMNIAGTTNMYMAGKQTFKSNRPQMSAKDAKKVMAALDAESD